jgi:cytoskeletal protein CcmA (bactofilin family)
MQDDQIATPTSILGRNSRIEGDINGNESVLIEGTLKGSLKVDGDIIIGASGRVEAELEGNNIFIHGTVSGNVVARQHLEIESSGKMSGDITAGSIDIKEGSSFEGRSRMIRSAVAPRPTDAMAPGDGTASPPPGDQPA